VAVGGLQIAMDDPLSPSTSSITSAVTPLLSSSPSIAAMWG
jgi:hypothetical protein